YGSTIPFFKPLFSVASIPAGSGTLEIRALDAAGTQVASQSIGGLSIVKPPTPLPFAFVATMGHPRIYISDQLTALRGRNDIAAQRFNKAVSDFQGVLRTNPDPTSPQ